MCLRKLLTCLFMVSVVLTKFASWDILPGAKIKTVSFRSQIKLLDILILFLFAISIDDPLADILIQKNKADRYYYRANRVPPLFVALFYVIKCARHDGTKASRFSNRLFPSAELCKSDRAVLWILYSGAAFTRRNIRQSRTTPTIC